MKNLITRAQELIISISSGKTTPEEIDILLNEIRGQMRTSPELGRNSVLLFPPLKPPLIPG